MRKTRKLIIGFIKNTLLQAADDDAFGLAGDYCGQDGGF
jgi:hypothetical protein